MHESVRAREALLRFYDAFTQAVPGDLETFDRVFTSEDALLIVGTAAHEWVRGREAGTQAWGMEGVSLEPGDPQAGRRARSPGPRTGRASCSARRGCRSACSRSCARREAS